MTPLLDYLQAQLLAAQLPGLLRESITPYISEAVPHYALPYDPDGKIAPDAPITMEITPPSTLVIRPFSGDLLDLVLVLNLILDDLAPMSRGEDKRLKISAEPLDNESAVVVITLNMRERVRYLPTPDGNLVINGIHYQRDPLQLPPTPRQLVTVRDVG